MVRLDADDYQVLLSGPDNFRLDVWPAYKSNRAGTPKPVLHSALKAHLRENHGAYHEGRLEADDLMGILASEPSQDERIMVSADKDMLTIPGLLFNPNKPLEGIKRTSQVTADKWHYWQTVVGDQTDGYPGIPGVGPKGAEALFKSRPEGQDPWFVIIDEYRRRGLPDEFALSQARLARILRHGDYDWNSKEIKLWEPPMPQGDPTGP